MAIAGRDRHTLDVVAKTLSREPLVFVVDLANPEAPAWLAGQAWDGLGGIDVVVNDAAVATRIPTEELDAATVDRLFTVNVRAPLLLIASLVPRMRSRQSGSIINLSSVSGIVGTPRRAAYAATKGRSGRRCHTFAGHQAWP